MVGKVRNCESGLSGWDLTYQSTDAAVASTVGFVCPALIISSQQTVRCRWLLEGKSATYTPCTGIVANGHTLINIDLSGLLQLDLAKVAPHAVAAVRVSGIVGKGEGHVDKGAAADAAVLAGAVGAKVLVLEHVQVGNGRVDVGQLVPVGHAARVPALVADQVLMDRHVVPVKGEKSTLRIVNTCDFSDVMVDMTYDTVDPDCLVNVRPVKIIPSSFGSSDTRRGRGVDQAEVCSNVR